jgi:hypothetical protein
MSGPNQPIPELQPIYHRPARSPGARDQWRAGVNWITGQGQFPEANGLYHALRHIRTRNVQVLVWGPPAYPVSNSGRGSDTLDEFGAVRVSFTLPKLDFMRALFTPHGGHAGHIRSLRSGQPSYAGQGTPDPFVAALIHDVGHYDFTGVWRVSFIELP